MKKLLGVFLCLFLLAGALLLTASPARAETEGDWEYSVADGKATVTKYNGAGGGVVIPETLGGYPVTGLGGSAFQGCATLRSVTIPASVTTIGTEAFDGCENLGRVNISDLVAWCGIEFGNGSANPLSYAHHLYLNGAEVTESAFPAGATVIKPYVFFGCSDLTSVMIPDSVTIIGNGAFCYCSGLTGVTIPDSVTYIGDYAFYGCTGLTSVTIPDSVTSIGDYAFYGCTGLTSVTIPDSVTSIGDYAFRYCTGLQSVTIPNSVTTIGSSTFSACSGLTSVTIPDSVTSIGDNAFCDCNGLFSVGPIGSGCDYQYGWTDVIPENAFSYCRNLVGAAFPATVREIGKNAFSGCGSLAQVYYGGTEAQWWDVLLYGGNGALNDATPHFGYKTGDQIFLSSGSCGDDLTWTLDQTHLLTVRGTGAMSDVEFSYKNAIRNAVMESGVTSIGYEAFYCCTGLTSVTIPTSVTSIGVSAFYKCSSLTSVTIPNSVTSIGIHAFSACSGLTSVTIPNSVTSIGHHAFENCTGLTGVTIPDSVTSIGSAFYGCTGLTSVTIPDSVEIIEEYAFYGCTGLTSVTIPDSVEYIAEDAFYGCTGLTDVYYAGTKEQWEKISIGSGNDLLTNATIHYGMCAVTFDANGGAGAMDPQNIPKGVAPALNANALAREGWSFTGWNTKADGTGTAYADKANVTLNAALTLYAQWSQSTVTVTFDANGGAGAMDPQNIPKGVATALNANAFAREGWSFTGWNTKADGTGTAYADKANVTLNAALTLYAQWSQSTVTVTFNANGGKGMMAPQNVPAETATALNANAFTRDGWSFTGWNTKPDGTGTAYADGATVTLNTALTLYAQWSQNTVTVTFDANGGAGTMAPQNVQQGVATALNANAFTRAGWGFTGWNTKADGTGTAYADNETVTLNERLTLYAQWSQNTVAVTFNANGGKGTMDPQNVPQGVATALKANAFTRDGWSFTGWNTKADGSGTPYADKATVTLSADLTLYAQWKQNFVAVSFDANGGTGTMDPQNVPQGVATALKANAFTRDGWTFTGWNTKADGTGTAYADGATVTLNAALTLYAQWSQNTVAVTFNANGGAGTMDPQNVPQGVATALNANAFTREGYTFTGWNTKADGTGTAYADKANVTLNANLTLYAQWSQSTVTVTFYANGGKGTMEPQNVPQGVATALNANAFTREGYTFTGWNTKADGTGTAYADKANVTLNADLTLYAQWKEIEPMTPELVSASEVSSGIQFKWKSANGAASYIVYRKVGSGSWKKLTEVNGTSYTDKSVEAGKTYTYTVRGKSVIGKLGAYDKTGLTVKTLGVPKLKSVAMVNSGVQVKWKATDGAAKYLVYRKTGSGSWKYIGATSKTTYTDKKVTAGKTYTYSVRAKNAAGKKSAYDKTGLKITYIAPPELVGVKQVRSGVKFTWKSAAGAEKYRVYRKVGSVKWKYLAQTSRTYYVDKKALSGKTYTYMVRAKDAYGHLSKYDTKGLKIKVK